MAIPGQDAVNQFLENEVRFDKFLNDPASYTDKNGNPIESLPHLTSTIAAMTLNITDKGPWITSTSYVKNDIVKENDVYYLCVLNHTSGTFATDLAANKWKIYLNVLREEFETFENSIANGTFLEGPTNQRVLQSNTESFGPFISRNNCTTANMDIFVDPSSGNDSNAGTQLAPLATIEAACQKLPKNIYHKVRIFLLDGDYSGQTITLFNYFVSPSGHAGLKIIGHVASWDGGTHPIYGSDDLDAVILDGSHTISGVIGTEELTLAGIKFVNSWVENYNSHLLLYKCKFDGGYTITGFQPRICLGGHSCTIVAQSCTFLNCAAVIDAENYVNALFDTCSVSGIIDSPQYPGTYGAPIRANNASCVVIKSSPTFYTAGFGGKKNTATNGSLIRDQFPYSEGGVNFIRRADSAETDYFHTNGGTGTAPNQARGASATAYGKNASGNNGKYLIEFGPNAAATFIARYVSAIGVSVDCFAVNASGDASFFRSFGLFGTVPPVAKPSIAGSRGGNAALASLLTALASFGLITDSTTA